MTAMIQTVKVKFNDEHFTSLQMRSWASGYNNVGMFDLVDDEMGYDDSTYLMLFLTNCIDPSLGGEIKEDNVLLVKANESGFFDRVYGPIILASEDESSLVMRSGANIFPIKQTPEGKFKLGMLVGDIETTELEFVDRDTQQKKKVYIPQVDFRLPSDRSIVYSIPMFTKTGVDGEYIKDLGRSGESIASYLKPVKAAGSGSYNVTRWSDLQPGEYKVVNIEKEVKQGDNGAWTSYTLFFDDGKATWINKRLTGILDDKLNVYLNLLKAGKPVTLIAEANLGKDGKTVYLNGHLLTREPLVALPTAPVAVKSLTSVEPAAIDVSAVDATQAKQDLNGDPNPKIPF